MTCHHLPPPQHLTCPEDGGTLIEIRSVGLEQPVQYVCGNCGAVYGPKA